MWKCAVIGVAGVIALSSGLAQAAELPPTVEAVAAALEDAGYDEVAVTLRVFGGYVVQASKDEDFVIVALAAGGKTLDHTQVFRDSDGDGVAGTDETLGPDVTAPLQSLIAAALSDPQGGGGDTRDVRSGAVEVSGFTQRSESLFSGTSLRASGHEVLGSGQVASTLERKVTHKDAVGEQRRAVQTEQLQSMSGFRIDDRIATVTESGGAPGAFLPLTLSSGFVDAEAIRADALSQAPDAGSLRATILGATPDAEALRSRILDGAPTADAIRATIVAPGPRP